MGPEGPTTWDRFGIQETIHDKTAERFREFRLLSDASAASNEILSAMDIKIGIETRFLGEIEDIKDEPSILRLVLKTKNALRKS
ncbi:hypothetical protein SLS62_011420 [Diatrype stigma]|uniref:Uncharacterized protein n=1 Tax=Diatrype stigma TaxID=117547 RepID=A0AAN9YFC4_9PEZI